MYKKYFMYLENVSYMKFSNRKEFTNASQYAKLHYILIGDANYIIVLSLCQKEGW